MILGRISRVSLIVQADQPDEIKSVRMTRNTIQDETKIDGFLSIECKNACC